MWCSTAWPSTRSKLPSAKGRRSASAASVRTSSPSARALAASVVEHARRDVAAGRLADQPGAQQVEREVAGARADLERAREVSGLPAERLAQLRDDLLAADLAEVDAPLGVVVVGRDVVVARVRVADLLGAEGGRHGAAPYTRAPCPRLPTRLARLRCATQLLTPTEYVQRDQPDGRAAARADGRAHAARRARGELLVPAPPRRLRVDRRARRGPARDRHGLRRGLRLRRARRARRRAWSASTPTPRPTSTRGCATGARTCASSATLVDELRRAGRRGRVPADDRARRATRARCSSTSARSSATPGAVFVSTPNVLTLAPKGAQRSGNPWHVHEYRARGVRGAVPRALRARSRCTACSTRASCARTSSRCALGWDRVHRAAAA